MTELNYAAMWAELSMLLDEEKYEAFLREKSPRITAFSFIQLDAAIFVPQFAK
jgi:hypothetical protein